MKRHEAPSVDEIKKATKKVKRKRKAKVVNGAAPPTSEPPDDATTFIEIERLAQLNVVAYQRQRDDAAEKLGFGVGVLDSLVRAKRAESAGGNRALPEIVPWPEPVSGAELLDEMAAIFKRHVILPTRAEEAAALWVLHTHCLDAADRTPRLGITSPTHRCGKTTLLELVTDLVPRALEADGISPAAVYRAVEKWHPTLMLDELDAYLPENEALRGVLNSGHSRGKGIVRVEGDDHDPVLFSTWCALAIALIGKLPGTLEDRSIHIELQRRSAGEKVERYLRRKRPYADTQRRCARWAADHVNDALCDADPEMPEEIADRLADNWRPLFAIADRAGGHWSGPTGKAREAALTLLQIDAAQSIGVMLLEDIRSVLTELGEVDRITSDTLAEKLKEKEDRPWPEFGRSRKAITTNAIARLLKPFHVAPVDMRNPETLKSCKGYYVEPLQAVFNRYLPPLYPPHPPYNRESATDPYATDIGGN